MVRGYGRYETTPFHPSDCWFGSRVAARGTRAAGGERNERSSAEPPSLHWVAGLSLSVRKRRARDGHAAKLRGAPDFHR